MSIVFCFLKHTLHGGFGRITCTFVRCFEEGPLYVNGYIRPILLTIFLRDIIASIYKIIHLALTFDRPSVRALPIEKRPQTPLSSLVKKGPVPKLPRDHLEVDPHLFPCFQSNFLSTTTSSFSRTNLPCANSNPRISFSSPIR